MKVLELFAGSRSIGKVCDNLGYQCFSVDIEKFDNIDLQKDIEYLEKKDIPFVPDCIWASPPCTSYSIAGIAHHRNGQSPKSECATKSDRLMNKLLSILSWYPNAIFFIENPVGMLRKMHFMKGIPRTTVTYCSYGDRRMKPTDIWSNHIGDPLFHNGWIPRPKCFKSNKKCHHESNVRSSTIRKFQQMGLNHLQGGVNSQRNAFERSKIPYQLCLEILNSIKL